MASDSDVVVLAHAEVVALINQLLSLEAKIEHNPQVTAVGHSYGHVLPGNL